MRVEEIIGIIQSHFILALVGVSALAALFCIGYFVIYKKMLHGQRKLHIKNALIWFLLAGYLIMVAGVTFLNRGSNFHGVNLQLFKTYVEAWHSFEARQWQFLILNIAMFLPLGILLPLAHSRFQRGIWTIGAALVFTVAIECVQRLTGFGAFDVDDIINNLLGATIGFGLTMGFINIIKTKKRMRSLLYFSPLIIVVLITAGVFAYYQMKEFGNLSIRSHGQVEMADVSISMDFDLSDQQTTAPVYKAPTYSKKAADNFVVDFFQRLEIDSTEMEILAYSDDIVYWVRSDPSYNVWFTLLDGSFDYTDFSSFDEDTELQDTDEEYLIEKLKSFGVEIPNEVSFQQDNVGAYSWVADQLVLGDELLDGAISISYYNDDTIKQLSNNLITYKKVRDVQIKTEQEAYQKILDGEFRYNNMYSDSGKVKSVEIEQVELSYILDSKGFFQPIYLFEGRINGEDSSIMIPAI